MQIFELHFNPKAKDDQFFDSFIYEPSTTYEKNLGSLYIAGDLENAFPQNSNLISNIAQTLKKRYYTLSFKNQNKALTESLKKANDFLADELKRNNVSWMGNFNLAVLSLKDYNLSFTATGSLKIILIRTRQINDIGKNIRTEEIEPYPLKVFFNVVSGKLIQNDIIIVATKNIYDFFAQEKILDKIARSTEINDKKLKEILPQKIFNQQENKDISGICLLISLSQDLQKNRPYQALGRKAKELIFEKARLSFVQNSFNSISKIINRIKIPKIKAELPKILNKLSKIKGETSQKIAEVKYDAESKEIKIPVFSAGKKETKMKNRMKLQVPKVSFSQIKDFFKKEEAKSRLILIGGLILILVIGFIFFGNNSGIQQNKQNKNLADMQQKLDKADELMQSKNEKEAMEILKSLWNEISSYKSNNLMASKMESIKNGVKNDMEKISRLENIGSPELVNDLSTQNLGFIPENILVSLNNLYFTTPISGKLYNFDTQNNNGSIIDLGKNIDLGDDSSDLLLFFSKPNNISYLIDNETKTETTDNADFKKGLFASYLLNIYFLDKENNQIMKCPYRGDFKWGNFEFSFKPSSKAKSIAVDGFVWILTDKNTIEKYYKGNLEKSFSLDIFPFSSNFEKIKTRSEIPYLYISEPKNKRIIVIDKDGKIVKQFYSEKFDNIKDFTISDNGRTIWLLNGSNIYSVSL
jgi:hypothetical protein